MNIFQKIINKEVPAKILYEDDKIIAFYDIKPQRKGHFLVVPKTYSKNLLDIKDEDLKYLFLKSRELARKQIDKQKVSGFNLVVNNGSHAGQEVFHTHIHIVPTNE